MPFVIGIDEAGYGPLLGPLVSCASAWRVAPEHWTRSFWPLLKDCVRKPGNKSDYYLPVGDSKEVFDRAKGICTLERTVLAFLAALNQSCPTLAALLVALGADGVHRATPPWYRDLETPLPLDPVRSKFEAAAERLKNTMLARAVECVALLAEAVPEDEYNHGLVRTQNKAVVLVERVLRLIERATALSNGEDVLIHVDRLGGRMDYRSLLQAAFPERDMIVILESPECSRYRLTNSQNRWFIEFVVDGDQQHLPIALASMTAKYLREALMHGFNAFWRQHAPHVKPTAGYYRDARRFLEELGPAIAAAGISPDQFVRAR